MSRKKRSDEAPPRQAEVTSSDVARRAGVSRTQVSYVLSGTGMTHVSAEKQELIRAAAKELGYRPHHSAQSLRRGFSSEFSIFFPAPYSPRINGMLGTIHETGLAGGCVVTQYSWNRFRENARRQEAFEAMLARRPMGIFCSLLDIGMKDIEYARARGIERILVFDVERHEDLPTLWLPVEAVGRLAASHFLAHGHGDIGIVKPLDPVQRRPFKLRVRGMRKVMALEGGGEPLVFEWPAGAMRPDLASARAFAAAFAALKRRPSALYAFSDDYALPLLRAFSEIGLNVPHDLAILGTDDLAYGEFASPTLSTIRFDSGELGARAVAMINALITGEELPEGFREAPAPILVQRESS